MTIKGIKDWIKYTLRFLGEDIWRTTDEQGVRRFGINFAKTLIITIRRFIEDRLPYKASALTYSTLLAIVPFLALLFAIAKGFGFENIIKSQLFDYFPAQKTAMEHILDFAQQYLGGIKDSGLFLGAGIILLLFTVVSLANSIEVMINGIWQLKRPRSIYRKFIDYISLMFIIPFLMILTSGFSVFMSTMFRNSALADILSPFVNIALQLMPYVFSWLIFTALYIYIPNTRVKIKHALISGFLSGIAFQFLQVFYIEGQLWISRYNTIYGSFAVLPLLMIWIQFSWIICLFGATLTFSLQNIHNYDFEQDTKKISRRYKDFVTIAIASIIAKRFEQGGKPLAIGDISFQYNIPYKLTAQVIYLLSDIGFILETNMDDDERQKLYLPAFDIHKMNVSTLLERIDRYGSERFKIDRINLFNTQWKMLIQTREQEYSGFEKYLLVDLVGDKLMCMLDQEKTTFWG